MVFKFLTVFALVAVASAGLLSEVPVKTIEEFNSHPEYTYTYGVEDTVSGDSKSLVESRDGDVVHGEYSLNDPDGYRRTVKYTADSLNGFNAVVDRKPLVEAVEHVETPVALEKIKPVHAPVLVKADEHYSAPVLVKTVEHAPAPTIVKAVTPITYSAPTLIKSIPITYSAPFAYPAPSYVAKSSFEPTLTYSSAPAIHKSVHLAYSAPTVVKSAPFAYFGPFAYTKSLPSVSQW